MLIRALVDRGELLSAQGRIAVGWLIVEDLFTVVVLVLLPSLAALSPTASGPESGLIETLSGVVLALLKAALFALIIVVIGVRLLPRLLAYVARLRDREMFTLAAVAIALGIAYLSFAVFGVSLALGAFLAGALVNESDTNDQVDADARPLREVFSVLFFVAVGMLFDPGYALANIPAIAAAVVVIVLVKAVTAFAIVAALGYPPRVGLTVAAGLAQIGEFSFILASAASMLGLLPDEGLQLVVGAAIVSITLNPFLFRAIDPLASRLRTNPRLARLRESRSPGLSQLPANDESPTLRGHAIVIGSGRVARLVIGALERRGFPFVVVSEDRHDVERLRAQGQSALFGDAANAGLLDRAGVAAARVVVVATPDAHVARLVVARAREVNPRVALVVRTHDQRHLAEVASLEGHAQAIHGELELGVQMTRYTLRRFGISTIEAEAIAEGLRGRSGRPWPLDPT